MINYTISIKILLTKVFKNKNTFNLQVEVFKLNRDGFKQNDLEVGLGVSGFLRPESSLNDDDDGNNDGRKNIGLLVWLSVK